MKTEVHRSKALLLTSSPVSLKQQMFPSTEPITARPEETFGDEKNGTSLRYDHKTSPLSCDGEKDSSDNNFSLLKFLLFLLLTGLRQSR